MSKYKKGRVLKGVVTGIEPYGIFIQFDDYYNGLIHISEISDEFVKNPNDFVEVGEIINVKIIDVNDKLGQLKLSIKNIKYREGKKVKRKEIKETETGFKTLAYQLPFWIEESLKKMENKVNSVDKKG